LPTGGFEIELSNGVLNLLFEEPTEARFVVSPKRPGTTDLGIAMSKSYKLSWAPRPARSR